MKRFYIIFLLLLSQHCLECRAQITIRARQNSPIYIGLTNMLEIHTKGYKDQEIIYMGSHGVFKPIDKNYYKVTKQEEASFWTYTTKTKGKLVIYAIHKRSKRIVDSTVCFAVMAPDPDAVYMVLKSGQFMFGGEYERPPYTSFGGMIASINRLPYDYRCRVIKYDVTIVKRSGKYFEVENYGDMISPDTKEALKNFQNGDTVYITRPVITCGLDSIPRNIPHKEVFYKLNNEIIKLGGR